MNTTFSSYDATVNQLRRYAKSEVEQMNATQVALYPSLESCAQELVRMVIAEDHFVTMLGGSGEYRMRMVEVAKQTLIALEIESRKPSSRTHTNGTR